MTDLYIGSNLKKMAERRGMTVEANALTVRRPRGWPTKSSKPFHLRRADGSHVASFADALAVISYLKGIEV
jgi:hypothetical protein